MIYDIMAVSMIGKELIIRLANEFCYCDNIDDAGYIFEQIEGVHLSKEQWKQK